MVAVDIIQGLLGGELSTYRGRHFRLDHAKIFDWPPKKPPVILAAGCDRIILNQVGPDQDAFFVFFNTELGPALRGKKAKAT